MQIALIIVSVGLLGVIIYFAISHKSSRPLKMAAIIALAVIGLSLGVCGFILIRGPGQSKTAVSLPFLLDDAPHQPPKKSNLAVIITFLVSFLFIVGLVLVTTMKEKQRMTLLQKKSPEKPVDPHIFEASGDLDIDNPSNEKEEENEESFDIGI
jgi:preprotein translocase subunit SecG